MRFDFQLKKEIITFVKYQGKELSVYNPGELMGLWWVGVSEY